jgi:hypothetical protein
MSLPAVSSGREPTEVQKQVLSAEVQERATTVVLATGVGVWQLRRAYPATTFQCCLRWAQIARGCPLRRVLGNLVDGDRREPIRDERFGTFRARPLVCRPQPNPSCHD